MPHSPGVARGAVQYDERGRPYVVMQGRRYYQSPMAMGHPAPEDEQGATFFRSRPSWNQETGEWERPINWPAVLSLMAGGGMAVGGLSAGGAFGGGGAGAGGATAGGSMANIGPVAAGGGTTGFSVPPALAAASGGPSLARSALGLGGEGLRGQLLRGGILGGLGAIGGATQGDSRNVSPELRRLWEQQLQRQRAQNPLYESIVQLAFNRLPVASRAGLSAPSLQQAAAQTPALQAGKYDEPPELRNLFRETEIRQRMSDPLFQAISALAQARLPITR